MHAIKENVLIECTKLSDEALFAVAEFLHKLYLQVDALAHHRRLCYCHLHYGACGCPHENDDNEEHPF